MITQWGKPITISDLRSHISDVLKSAGMIPSSEVINISRLPEKVKDRSFTVLVSAEQGPDRSLKTVSAELSITVNYVKLTGATGSQLPPLDQAYLDVDNIFMEIMSDNLLIRKDIKHVSISEPQQVGSTIVFTLNFTCLVQLDTQRR